MTECIKNKKNSSLAPYEGNDLFHPFIVYVHVHLMYLILATHFSEGDPTGPQSCLSSGLKDLESPKKHVTFYDYLNGKENLRQKTGYRAFTFNTYSGLYSTNNVSSHEQVSHEDLKNRLFRAKGRAAGVRDDSLESNYTSRNLLHFR